MGLGFRNEGLDLVRLQHGGFHAHGRPVRSRVWGVGFRDAGLGTRQVVGHAIQIERGMVEHG